MVTSYKGEGVFPEDDNRWLGVTGVEMERPSAASAEGYRTDFSFN